MIKKLLFAGGILLCAGLLSGCSLRKAPAALQISAQPPANVFIDGKLLGKTPYQGDNWEAKEYSIKLIPESTTTPMASWESKVKLTSGVLTLIEREFGSSEALSSGQILSLEKTKDKEKAKLTIISNPDGALIHLDGEAKGFTPIKLDEVGVGDHQIELAKEGFVEKTVKARAAAGFELIVNVKLAQESDSTTSATDSAKPASDSSVVDSETKTEVEIKETPTGWLRVRKGPSTTTAEIAKVNPGEKYPLLEEKSGWYRIQLEEDQEGWISGQYATKI
ncbi:MAG TPA: PEGA domain-containing protein [Clostridia bacterium]|nr:PEGA domain-containing protein [Clostridia bacterium]